MLRRVMNFLKVFYLCKRGNVQMPTDLWKEALLGLGIFISCLSCSATLADEGSVNQILEGLSAKEKEGLFRGETILRTEDIKDQSWPTVHLIRILSTSALDGMSVYADFENQKDYVPNMIKSQIVRQIAPQSLLVAYGFHMPWPIKDLYYSTINTVQENRSSGPGEVSYSLRWKSEEDKGPMQTEGEVTFHTLTASQAREAGGKDALQLKSWAQSPGENSLVVYKNTVRPSSFIAPLLRSRFIKDTLSTFEKIIQHIVHVHGQKPELLKSQRSRLQAILRGEDIPGSQGQPEKKGAPGEEGAERGPVLDGKLQDS